jgi:hypothetical protein
VELYDLYSPLNIIRVIKSRTMRLAWHVARNGDRKYAYRVLLGRPEGKKPLGRPRLRGEDNIKMDLQEVAWGSMNWIDLSQHRDRWWVLVKAVMNLPVPKAVGYFLIKLLLCSME